MSKSTELHEQQLSEKTINMHRAIISLIEELEAIDWYTQRAEACQDAQLQAVIKHNRDEEIEHASMTLEWIRRNFPKFNDSLKLYLFTSGDITAIEKEAENEGKEGEKGAGLPKTSRRFTVGDMKGN
jgi:ferritin-like protein